MELEHFLSRCYQSSSSLSSSAWSERSTSSQIYFVLIIAFAGDLVKIWRPEAKALFCGSALPYYYQLLWAYPTLPTTAIHANTDSYKIHTHTDIHTDTYTHTHSRAKYCWVHSLSCMQFGRVWSDILVRSDWYAASDDQTLSHKNNSFHCKLVHCGTMWQILVCLIYLCRL